MHIRLILVPRVEGGSSIFGILLSDLFQLLLDALVAPERLKLLAAKLGSSEVPSASMIMGPPHSIQTLSKSVSFSITWALTANYVFRYLSNIVIKSDVCNACLAPLACFKLRLLAYDSNVWKVYSPKLLVWAKLSACPAVVAAPITVAVWQGLTTMMSRAAPPRIPPNWRPSAAPTPLTPVGIPVTSKTRM